jgi:ferric-dicitrate binding protein FerR (iron transport regulator)
LLEGAVKVNAHHHSQMLAPGQQAQVDTGAGSIRLEKNVNTEQVVAWKNGIFDFNQADVKTVMRQIGRWYDVEIVYEKGVDTQEQFVGEMQRSLSLSQVLKGLEQMGLKFKIENGHRLIVMPS